MAYCTYSDVDALMSLTHSASTLPTSTSVTDFCVDVSSELDGVAQAVGYTVPVTSAAALAMMNSYATMGAAVKTWHAGFQSSDEPANVAYWNESYNAFLTRLRKGEQTLPDEVIAGGNTTAPAFSAAPKAARYWASKRTIQESE